MNQRQSWQLSPLIAALLTAGSAVGLWVGLPVHSAVAQSRRLRDVRNPEQVPTARYGRGESVDLSLIVEEWRDRYPAIPVFVCTCNAETCGDPETWPFREFTRYQPFVALGDLNAANDESTGFNCFDMATGVRPE